MINFKILIDTNIVIGLEDAQPVKASFSEVVRLCQEHGVGLFVDEANYDDIRRDADINRRAVTLSKLEKFPRLAPLKRQSENELVSRFGPISSDNDRSDVRLLTLLDAKAVDFLITQDNGIHRRATRAALDANVLTIEDALYWLRRTFKEKAVALPYVLERKAYQLDVGDSIFQSLQADYPPFKEWFDKCRRQHRDCWVLQINDQIAGLVIRKDEPHSEANTKNFGHKILKICTFKVRDEFRGEKFGELLLKQALWFAQRNKYDLTYLTVFPKHIFLRDLLAYFGFTETKQLPSGETMMEKVLRTGAIPDPAASPFELDREIYPRFYDGGLSRKFCVPIIPTYHRRLFPEIAYGVELPLFPTQEFGPILYRGESRAPGNTIRKVYLCRAKTNRIRPGDLLFFYMSKEESFRFSQTITTVSVAEQMTQATSTDDLIRLTAKRSVFSAEELHAMDASASSPVKVIDFLLIGHAEPPVTLEELIRDGVFSRRPPQSIAEISEASYYQLKSLLSLGF
jgi:ribosomal protein S18 acetylase RimI-like enzyme